MANVLGLHSWRAGPISRPKFIFFILSKFMKIFASPHFYAGNAMALLFFHENFWKNWKKVLDFFEIFQKLSSKNNNTIVFPT
jgi:hypothetical protein